jgi:ABC-type thiamine transport system substrate-binding protein
VWSYLTSEAYHRENAGGERYQAQLLDQEALLQIEGVAKVKGAAAPESALRCFFDQALGGPLQSELPKKQWMVPARAGVTLPASFLALPRPKQVWSPEPTAKEHEDWLREWRLALQW